MSFLRRSLMILGLVVLSGGAGGTPPDKVLDDAWIGLEKAEPEASRALLVFADHPSEAVPFFAERLRPLRADPDWLDVHLKNLESDKDDVWKPAFQELEYSDPRLSRSLDALMKEVTISPARQRMVEVLSGREAGSLGTKDVKLNQHGQGKEIFYNFLADNGSWWAEASVAKLNSNDWGNPKKKWTRAVRAEVLLEHIGTPEALAILETMALGDPDAQPTRVAKDALERIAAKGK